MRREHPGSPRDGSRWSGALRSDLARIALLAAVYFFGGKLGLALALFNRSASPVWPPTGIAIAALLVFGTRLWPGVFVGAFFVNLTTAGTPLTCLAIAAGNTLEAVIGARLAERYAHGRAFPLDAANIFRFAGLVALPSTAVGATVGATTLILGGLARWDDYLAVWLTWWLGDLVSAVIVTPMLLIWGTLPRIRWNRWNVAEFVLILATTIAVGILVFGGMLPSGMQSYARSYMTIPPLLWAAFRFGQRGALTSVIALALIVGWETLRGSGPLVEGAPNQSLLLAQMFMGTAALTSLVLGAVASEYREAEDALRASRAELRRQLAEIETLYRTAPVGLCQIDAGSRLVRINEALAAMFGLPASDQRGRTVRETMPGLAGALEPLLGRVLATGEPCVGQEIAGMTPAPTGDVRHWMTSLYPVPGPDGAVAGANVVVQDITESKRAEAELLAWHQELESRVRSRTADLTSANRALEIQMQEGRRLEAQILRVAESEQVRLGSELHDGIGQRLTGIGLLLAGLRQKLAARSPDLTEETARLQVLVDESLRQTQGLARRLYPVELEGVGLLSALRRLARTTKRTFGATCVVRADGLGEDPAGGPVAIQLFRIVQEAVHNAIKHGKARHIVVDLARHGDNLALTVTDDGTGLPADRETSRGMGLRIMLYRARMVGGTLDIINGPGGGAILTCTVPAEGTPSPHEAGAWEPIAWKT